MGNESDSNDRMTATPPPAPDVYAIFCGGIDQGAAQRVVNFLSVGLSSPNRPATMHVLFQSAGGYVGDGVFLYNLFRAIPFELILYNSGQISSAGVIAYLGAKNRRTSTRATFMMHKSTNSPQFAGSATLQKVAKNLMLDDDRTESILREHVKAMPDALWTEMEFHDLYVSGDEAVQFGIAHEIGEFSPPSGVKVFNMLA